MRLSKHFLRVSLALWRRRWRYRHNKSVAAHKRGDKKAIHKWGVLLAEAVRNIHKREKQLTEFYPSKPLTWMPHVRHLPRTGAGSFASGYAPRGVLHTTEGSGDATSTLDANGSHPHFQVEQNGRITQYLPLNQAGKALRHVAWPETNKAHAIQIEVCGFAAKPKWPAVQVDAMRRLMRFIEHNAGVKRVAHVKFVSGGGQRLSPQAWVKLVGWCGHQHVPQNDHVDPGSINIHALLD